MKKTNLLALALCLFLAGVTITATGFAAQADSDRDGLPDNTEALLGTDPLNADTDGDKISDFKDKEPTNLTDPIDQKGSPAPFSIKEALVENNYDYDKKQDATDHFEMELANSSKVKIANFSIYYTIKDADTGKVEAYFLPLTGFALPAAGNARIHLDEGKAPGHFQANPNSSYVKSMAAKIIQFKVKADGYLPVTVTVNKDKGGAEIAD